MVSIILYLLDGSSIALYAARALDGVAAMTVIMVVLAIYTTTAVEFSSTWFYYGSTWFYYGSTWFEFSST